MENAERELRAELMNVYEETQAQMHKLIKCLLGATLVLVICFTIIITTITIEHQKTLSNISSDYFTTDYLYGTIEQSVDINNGGDK